MKIIEVNDKKTAAAFLNLTGKIYEGDPNWIPHLDKDIEAVFDPAVNKYFEAGEACRWLLLDEGGNPVGRVAAFINRNLAWTFKQPTGGMGFFECIDDQKAAGLLFDTCKNWLRQRGMEAMDGPINFGEKERFWGLLVDGFEKRPPYLLNYNPAYYKDLFENYGFRNYYEQYVYQIDPNTELPAILKKKFQRLTETQGYHFETMQKKHIEKYAEDFMSIYNKAWGQAHKSFKPMTKDQALKSFASMKSIIDEDLIVFGYHHGQPVAFFISIPELNELFRYVNGRLNMRGKLLFLYHRWRRKFTTIYGLVFGIVPEYQNRGLESALIMSLQRKVAEKPHYTNMYITWLGDFNPKMIRIVEHIGAQKAFTLVTYRYLFDPGAAFERHPVLD